MFTIKYRAYRRAPQQPTDGSTNYCVHEQLHGPFAFVSQEIDDCSGAMVVHAHGDVAGSDDPRVMFGPIITDNDGTPRPVVWVMNETGATVARYDL